MRYFKYKDIWKTYRRAEKAEIAQMPKAQRRKIYQSNVWQVLGVIVLFLVAGLCMGIGSNLMLRIPQPNNIVLSILYFCAIIVAVFILMILGLLLGGVVAAPILSKAEYPPVRIGRASMYRGCAHLRRYYGLQEPYVITKCFACSNENFKDHDVCLFVYGGELRITADLIRGFANGGNDLGCYAFRADEITLTKVEHGGHLALELKAEKVTFLLGYRAKSFIQKHYSSM